MRLFFLGCACAASSSHTRPNPSRLPHAVLAVDALDQDALKCKIVAQIHCDRSIADVLTLFSRLKDENKQEMALEKARQRKCLPSRSLHCPVRTPGSGLAAGLLPVPSEPAGGGSPDGGGFGRGEACRPPDARGPDPVSAGQVHGSAGNLPQGDQGMVWGCFWWWWRLDSRSALVCLQAHADDIDSPNEVKSNAIAAYVSAGRQSEVRAAMDAFKMSATGSGFEAAFNYACALIELEDFQAAGEQLEIAARCAVGRGRGTRCPSVRRLEPPTQPSSKWISSLALRMLLTLGLLHVLRRLGREALMEDSDDVSPEELAEELAPVTAQVSARTAFADSGHEQEEERDEWRELAGRQPLATKGNGRLAPWTRDPGVGKGALPLQRNNGPGAAPSSLQNSYVLSCRGLYDESLKALEGLLANGLQVRDAAAYGLCSLAVRPAGDVGIGPHLNGSPPRDRGRELLPVGWP